MRFRYMVLSGELASEGIWSHATTYDALVADVKEAWGDDFIPLFKYKMECTESGAAEERRYQRADACYKYSTAPACRPVTKEAGNPSREDEEMYCMLDQRAREQCLDGECCGDNDDALGETPAGMHGRCFVIIDDESDFRLWLNGGTLLAAETAEEGKLCVETGSAPELLSTRLYAYRKTTVSSTSTFTSCGIGTSCSGSPAKGSASGATSSSVPVATYVESRDACSAHPYYCTQTSRDGVHRFRSSPAVKHDGSDVVRVPRHTLLPSALLAKLGVTVALRHSNAPELILWSPSAAGALGDGVGYWGQLVLKAQSAWGIHTPVFRYLDASRGLTQMHVCNVKDFRFWCERNSGEVDEGKGEASCELLVLEKAPSAHLVHDAADRENIRRYYEAHAPDGMTSASLKGMIEQLKELESLVRGAEVARHEPFYVSRDASDFADALPLHRHGMRSAAGGQPAAAVSASAAHAHTYTEVCDTASPSAAEMNQRSNWNGRVVEGSASTTGRFLPRGTGGMSRATFDEKVRMFTVPAMPRGVDDNAFLESRGARVLAGCAADFVSSRRTGSRPTTGEHKTVIHYCYPTLSHETCSVAAGVATGHYGLTFSVPNTEAPACTYPVEVLESMKSWQCARAVEHQKRLSECIKRAHEQRTLKTQTSGAN